CFYHSADASRFEGTSWFQVERCSHRPCCFWRFDVGDSKNAVPFVRPAPYSRAHSQANRPSTDDRLRVAVRMRRGSTYCRAHWRACAGNGGQAMKKMKQTLNAKRSTPNAELRRASQLDIGRWTLSVGRFLPGVR